MINIETELRFSFVKQIKRFFLKTIGQVIPSDIFAPRFPVSVKGICVIEGKVVLLKNELDEWDLPGGKLERRESPYSAVIREIKEELNIDVTETMLCDTFNICIRNKVNVLIILYECAFLNAMSDLRMGYESFGMALFTKEELDTLSINPKYLPYLKAALKT